MTVRDPRQGAQRSSARRFLQAFLPAAVANGLAALGLGWVWKWAVSLGQPQWKSFFANALVKFAPPVLGLLIASLLLAIFHKLLFKSVTLGPPPIPSFAAAGCGNLLLLLLAVLALVLIVPVLLIYWTTAPHGHKKAIQAAALLVCLAGSIVYYLLRPASLPSVADKVGFFGGVALGPPTALEFLLPD